MTLPAVHTRHIIELLRRWNVTCADVLGPLGIDEATLDDPAARMPLPDVERIVVRAIELTGEPGLGFYMALEMRISWHGYLGFAAMTAGTLRQALEIAERFIPTRTSALDLRFVVEGEHASLVLEERADFGAAREVIVVGLLLGIANIGKALTAKDDLDGYAELALPEPPHFARFAHLFQGVHFARPAHRLVFPASLLDLPLTLGDPASLKLATERCEEELRALGFDARASARLRALLLQSAQSSPAQSSSAPFPSADEAARALGMSARTLKRRLAEESTSFSEILDDIRRQRALLLLSDRSLTVAEIASRLGYADAASFSHAFQRWTGQSPAATRGKSPPSSGT